MFAKALMSGLLAAILVLTGAAQPAVAEILYALDDGVGDAARGYSNPNGSFVVANQFTVQPGGEAINAIDVCYSSEGAAGTPVQLILFKDQNNSATPDAPVLIASVPSAVTDPGTGTFFRTPIPPTLVTGNFFAGIIVNARPANGLFPINSDRTTPQQRSYWAWFDSQVGINDLPAISYDPTTNAHETLAVNSYHFLVSIGGNPMIRAEGVPAPEPSTLALLGIGAAGLLGQAWRRRKRVPASRANACRGRVGYTP